MNTLPSNVLRHAQRIVMAQDSTPVSPCAADNKGNVVLCAAAAVAAAALEIRSGSQERHLFEKELATSGDSGRVRDVFTSFGWSTELCNILMRQNDSFSDRRRTELVSGLLESMA